MEARYICIERNTLKSRLRLMQDRTRQGRKVPRGTCQKR